MHHPANSQYRILTRKLAQLLSNGSLQAAHILYKHLHSSGCLRPSLFLLPSLLKSCSSSPFLSLALQLHSTILKSGHTSHPITMNSLLTAYSKHSLIDSARLTFDTMPIRDTISYSSMIHGYIAHGYLYESIKLFKEMQLLGFAAKPELVSSVMSVCGRMGNLMHGKAIHARALHSGEFETCVLLSTSIVDMYSRCYDLVSALKVFDSMLERNEVSWTAMIMGCAMNGSHGVALDVFRGMGVEGIKPNKATLVSVLPACGELESLRQGKEIHAYVFRHGFELEPQIVGAMIDMYGKCKGGYRLALVVFERAEGRDIVIWSSMMNGSSRNGDNIGTMAHFVRMKKDGIKPNSVTMLAVLAACIGLSSIDYGQGVHGYILKSGLLSDVFIRNSLIDMYAKCGCLESSLQAFVEMPLKDSVSYSCMISGYGIHGHGYEALRLFDQMQEMGVKPDDITFLSVLSACSHSGLVDEGKKLFDHMTKFYGIIPSLEHYSCYVDLLGRSGLLEDACEVIRSMWMKPNSKILGSLALACRVHGRFEEAERLALWLIDSEPKNAANYALLSSIYAEVSNWTGIEEARRDMKERGLRKNSGCSQIEDGVQGLPWKEPLMIEQIVKKT